MADSDSSEFRTFLFKTVQDLGMPKVSMPQCPGKLVVALQFVIPGLVICEGDKEKFIKIVENNITEIEEINLDKVNSVNNNSAATLVTFGFYMPNYTDEEKLNKSVESKCVILIEKYLGILSFCAGIKLVPAHQQCTIIRASQVRKILPAIGISESPRIDFAVPEQIYERSTVNDNVFKALFWLRRGLSEQDLIETYSALMICLQILARDCGLIAMNQQSKKCPVCGTQSKPEDPAITALVRELVVTRLAAPKELFNKMWRLRNKIVAHGNKPLSADVFKELAEMKMDTLDLAFKGVNLAMGIDPLTGPTPNQRLLVVSTFMSLG